MTKWKRTKFVDFERLNKQQDTTIRDAEICSMYHGLNFSDLSYEDKIKYIADNYFISDKSVEAFLAKKP